ncbi:MAG: hypothetical protein ABI561_06425 [Bradyrhizobium sp.]
MQNAAVAGATPGADGQNDTYQSVVSSLAGLVEHVQASLRQIEQAMVREASLGDQETAAGVIVLDDVSPRYVRATAALRVCDANLGAALHSLLDSGTPSHGTSAYAESPSVFSMVRM